jgi:hypothetical protein
MHKCDVDGCPRNTHLVQLNDRWLCFMHHSEELVVALIQWRRGQISELPMSLKKPMAWTRQT